MNENKYSLENKLLKQRIAKLEAALDIYAEVINWTESENPEYHEWHETNCKPWSIAQEALKK